MHYLACLHLTSLASPSCLLETLTRRRKNKSSKKPKFLPTFLGSNAVNPKCETADYFFASGLPSFYLACRGQMVLRPRNVELAWRRSSPRNQDVVEAPTGLLFMWCGACWRSVRLVESHDETGNVAGVVRLFCNSADIPGSLILAWLLSTFLFGIGICIGQVHRTDVPWNRISSKCS